MPRLIEQCRITVLSPSNHEIDMTCLSEACLFPCRKAEPHALNQTTTRGIEDNRGRAGWPKRTHNC